MRPEKELREDNSGFVHFPPTGKMVTRMETGKTFIYIVAFDSVDMSNSAYLLSNLRLLMPGSFVSDDINMRQSSKEFKISIDELIKGTLKDNEYDNLYFPNYNSEYNLKKLMSMPITSAICVGWSDYSYEIRDNIGNWTASFRDLTNEGRKLYYSIKKLHNNKEVRILTFNNI